MRGFAVTVDFRLHWGEMDALGHVNNAQFFTWFETARIEYFQRLGLLVEGGADLGPILRKTDCEFLRPVVFPANLVVGARISQLGNTSLTMEYAVARQEAPDELLARGVGIVVLVNYRTGEKVRIPDELRAKIDAIEAGRVS